MSEYSEGEIAIEAVRVVEEFGEIDMSRLIAELTVRMKPDGHDGRILAGRNDTYFSQKVRNLRSHNNKIFFSEVRYCKSTGKYVSREFEEYKRTKSGTEYAALVREKQDRTKKFYARKIDFAGLNAKREEIGKLGEALVFSDQKRKVAQFDASMVKCIRHVAKNEGDGAGYDILSFDRDGRVLYIEVKSTEGDKETPFYMSSTEYAFYELHKVNYIVARVYNLKADTGEGEIEYIPGGSFERIFEKEASEYRVFYKKN